VNRRTATARAAAAVAVLCSAGCLQMQKDLPPRPVAAVADARPGGTVTVAIATPTSIDPALVPPADSAGSLVVRTMCDPLLATDPATGTVRPDLAQSVRVSAGGTVVTIRLRRGVRFDDGSRLAAADVVAALTRVARPQVASPNAALLQHVLGYQQLHNDDERAHGRLAGVTVVDPRTVQVALTTADAGWVRTLTTTAAVPIPRHDAADNGFGAFSTRPVCVGPYRLAAPWRPGDPSLTLVRAEGYDGGNPGETRAGRGWADRIVFRVYASEQAAYDAYLRGEADIAQVPPAQADAATRRLGPALVSAPDATVGYLGLPTTVPPFDDPDLRVALSLALDRTAIARDVYHGGRTPARGLYPPVVGDDLWRPAACTATAPATADPAAARRRLGTKLAALRRSTYSFYYDDEFANAALVTAVAQQWHRALGLTFRPVAMQWDDYIAKAVHAPGLDGPFRLSYAAPTAGAVDYVRDLLSSAAIDVGNATRWSDRQTDTALTHGASEHSGEVANEALRFVELRFCDQLPLIPVTWNDEVWAWRPEVGAAGGRQLDRATGLPLLRESFRRAG
jgi:ABC-type transport system substrate-binding protein